MTIPERDCSGCGKPFPLGARDRNPRKWCSEACRVKTHRERARREDRAPDRTALASPVRYFVCVLCGSLAVARGRGQVPATCGRECNRRHRAQLYREAYRSSPALRDYRVRHRAGLTEEQRARRRAADRAAGYRPSKRAADQRRRARLAGATVERFDPVEVFDRDGWVCGICSQPIDRALSYPDCGSVSLDHVLPLSLGGDHSKANTRASHLGCNIRRGNKLTAADHHAAGPLGADGAPDPGGAPDGRQGVRAEAG